jgi:hypothetical protein
MPQETGRKVLTDFEKLLFAEDYIKILKAKVSSLEIELGKANAYISEIDSLSSANKIEIKRGRVYEEYKGLQQKHEKTIRELRVENQRLNHDLIQERLKNQKK